MSPSTSDSADTYFTPRFFEFLRELTANNRKEWFEPNKQRYRDDVKEPMLHFIADLGPRLRTISEHLNADPRPSGGSMFRIYRDTRFSKDKSPYKTNIAARIGGRGGTGPCRIVARVALPSSLGMSVRTNCSNASAAAAWALSTVRDTGVVVKS
jgi:uncharacterized protein DUF2461